MAKAPEEREGLTRGTNAPSDATATSASEGDREEPAARAKPGDRGSPAKAELGESPWYKSSPLLSGIPRLAPDGKTLPASVTNGHAEILRSLRGHEIRFLLVYHNPEGATKREERLDGLFGFPLRGGENQPAIQIAEKSDPVRV